MNQLCIAATSEAVRDSGIDEADVPEHRTGVSFGCLSNMLDLKQMEDWRQLIAKNDPPLYPEFTQEYELQLPQVTVPRTINDRWKIGGPSFL
ncbi:MAG: beta-ketoacyl synthase N-terminal-like domain-containing protein [Planctomycetaceae bacterium]